MAYKLNGKKDLANMIRKAHNEHMMFIEPVYLTKVSKQYSGLQYCNPLADHDSYTAEFHGSPADIRKAIRYAENEHNIFSLYANFPCMRENRIYALYVYEGYWTVQRIWKPSDIVVKDCSETEKIINEMTIRFKNGAI